MMHYVDHYVIQWDRVQSLDDLKRLIAAMQITFEPNHQYLDTIMDLVEREKKPTHGLSVMD